MPIALKIISDVLLAVGAFFALVGVIGILRMPDVYSRMQASTCVTTLGFLGLGLGALLHAVFIKNCATSAVKILVVCLLVLVTNPVGAHALAKGAYWAGIRPEKPMETDDLGRDSQ